jgi:hypothetical protein
VVVEMGGKKQILFILFHEECNTIYSRRGGKRRRDYITRGVGRI